MISIKETRQIMGMPITVHIVDGTADEIERIFEFFTDIDQRFSTYKDDSEISKINRGELKEEDWSREMTEIMRMAEETKRESDGYFDIVKADGTRDPSGIVKGWAIQQAAALLKEMNKEHFYIDAGGDIQTSGMNEDHAPWTVGIRHPILHDMIVKVVTPGDKGVATSGTYERGEHIYDPHTGKPADTPFTSFTVIGPNVYEADRFATAAFAMGKNGIYFIENIPDLEAYAIDQNGMALATSGFHTYTDPA
jgi:thiamine biosynthesis lipoprotein